MSAQLVSTLIITGIAVAGSIGSVLLLAFRVGSLAGSTTALINHADREIIRTQTDLTKVSDRLSLHIEHHTTSP